MGWGKHRGDAASEVSEQTSSEVAVWGAGACIVSLTRCGSCVFPQSQSALQSAFGGPDGRGSDCDGAHLQDGGGLLEEAGSLVAVDTGRREATPRSFDIFLRRPLRRSRRATARLDHLILREPSGVVKRHVFGLDFDGSRKLSSAPTPRGMRRGRTRMSRTSSRIRRWEYT
eukprot:scaffold407_cov251-Pinguiococcus_pyrenoidosus.AAC.36